MAGLINWRKVSPPVSSPDTNHLYVGVDPTDCKLYIKDDTGTVFKYLTSGDLATELADYDLSTVVDSKITNAINNLISGAPATLDTLNELAAALADDANFAATIASNIATVQSDIDTHEANTSNPHSTTAAQVGAYTTAQTDTQISNAVTAHTSAGDPHPQYETSVEAQAKVDAHATLTNNPHAVTKSQVGLSNVDNTSDLNKPVSTATQTALNLKYDSSNPSGYQTAAQVTSTVSAASTADRARANHTGTQLANTISDFASNVRSTVLTGLSTATNAVIDATDTVLSALGKLQKQLSDAVNSVNATLAVINGRLDNLEAEVFGKNYQYFTDTTLSTTTSGAQPLTAVASSFTTASVSAGTYRIGIQYHWTNNSVTADSRFALFVDGVQIGNQHNEEYQDSTSNKNDQIIGNVTLGAGTHTIELRFGSEALITTTVNRVDCEFWRVS